MVAERCESPLTAHAGGRLDDFSDGIVAWLDANTKAVVPLTAHAGGRLGWSEPRGLLYTPMRNYVY